MFDIVESKNMNLKAMEIQNIEDYLDYLLSKGNLNVNKTKKIIFTDQVGGSNL